MFFIISSYDIKGVVNYAVSNRFIQNRIVKKWSNKPRAGLFDQRHQIVNDAKSLIAGFKSMTRY